MVGENDPYHGVEPYALYLSCTEDLTRVWRLSYVCLALLFFQHHKLSMKRTVSICSWCHGLAVGIVVLCVLTPTNIPSCNLSFISFRFGIMCKWNCAYSSTESVCQQKFCAFEQKTTRLKDS